MPAQQQGELTHTTITNNSHTTTTRHNIPTATRSVTSIMENPQLPPHLRPSPTVTKRPPRPLPDDRVVRPLPHPSPASPVSPVTARQGRAHWPSCGPRTSAPRHGTPHKPRQLTRPHCVPARRLTHNELQQLPPIAISTPTPFTNRDETPSPSAPRRRPRPRRRPGRPSPPGRAEHTGPAVAHVHLSSVSAHLTNRVSTHVRTVSQLAA